MPVLAVTAATALGLRLVKEAPPILAGETQVVSYSSVNDAERALGVSLTIPSYFPDYLSWPPKSVLGQKRPYPAALIAIASQIDDKEVLWIFQSAGSQEESSLPMPKPAVVYQKAVANINSIAGELVTGKSATGAFLYQVSWREGETRHTVIATLPLSETLDMTRSMTTH